MLVRKGAVDAVVETPAPGTAYFEPGPAGRLRDGGDEWVEHEDDEEEDLDAIEHELQNALRRLEETDAMPQGSFAPTPGRLAHVAPPHRPDI